MNTTLKINTMKMEMKNLVRWALVMLIAFVTPCAAQAQFGVLKKVAREKIQEKKDKAKEKAKEKVKELKADAKEVVRDAVPIQEGELKGKVESLTSSPDDDPYGGNQVEQLMKRKQEASAKMDAEREARQKAGCKITESGRDQQIGTWVSRENKLTCTEHGETYMVDYNAGIIRNSKGQTVATLTEGGIDFPSINAKVITKNGGLIINGESVGNVTAQDIHLYGRRLGYFSCEANRDLVAFFFLTHTPYGQPEMRAKMKFTQFMDGNFMNAKGVRIGYIKSGQIYNVDKYYPKLGNLHYSDDETVIADNKYRVGALKFDGTVLDNNGNKIGAVKENGDILNASGSCVAHVSKDGKITDKAGKLLVQFSGNRPISAAVAYYFFFRERIR